MYIIFVKAHSASLATLLELYSDQQSSYLVFVDLVSAFRPPPQKMTRTFRAVFWVESFYSHRDLRSAESSMTDMANLEAALLVIHTPMT